MALFTETFKHDVIFKSASAQTIERDLQRQVARNTDAVVTACREKGVSHLGATRIDGCALTFEWSLDTELGVEKIEMFKLGFPIPLLTIKKPLPWCGQDNHKQMSEFVEYHLNNNGPESQFRTALEAVLDMLQAVTVELLELDLFTMRNRSNVLVAKSTTREDVQ